MNKEKILVDNQPHSSNLLIQRAYQSLFLSLDNGVIIVDQYHKIIQMNPVAEALVGISQHKVTGQTFDDVMSSQHNISLSLETLPDDPIKLLYDDKTGYYRLSLKQLPDQLGYIVIFDDVTRERNALKRVDKLLSSYSDYAHTVGHDVKSPLGVAIGYSNMLQSELEQGTEAHLFADEIFDTSMRIMHICNELLLLSELQTRKKADIASINLNSLLETVMRRFKKDIDNQGIIVTIADSMPVVKGNLPWVEEVLVDYLQYVIIDRSPTRIEIGTEEQADTMIQIWVNHDGQALSADEQTTLFDSTQTLEQIRAEGHGLGLAIAKQLVEKLRGTVGIDGRQMIYFTLPIDGGQK